MVSVKKIVASALVGVLMFSAVGCNMVEKTQAAIDKTTVATVNGEKITLGEVDSHLKGFLEQLKSQYGDKYMDDPQAAQQILQQRQVILNSMVEEKVLVDEAKKENLVPSEEELNKKVDEQVKQYKEQYGEEGYKTAVENIGYTEDTFKEFLKNQVIAEATLEYATKDVKVSDEDIKKYYDENKQQFAVKAGADVKHLLLPTEEEAQKAYDEIQSGQTTFDDLFNKYGKNTDPKKEPIAEDLGRVDYTNSNFDKDFMEGLKGLKDGEISKPVKSSFGYHIIKATNVTDKETQLTEEQAKSKIMSILENQKKREAYQKDLDQWKKDFNVKVYDDKLQEGLKISK
ncbi:TPA: peptidylprolyl isomerase [Clostridium perfringens]|uniref:peptidylprolyl isomerase n=1 Tax=Clostridium perfringens TaxID=1502 RepID=UPI000BBB4D0C|nr:peptidylprolyl isomerase [Clostridium perfringens]HAT4247288.1 peptidylprolyl isomerase [Clostridium perfringens]